MCRCPLPSRGSWGDLAAPGPSSGISRWPRGALPAPDIYQLLGPEGACE